MEEILNSDRKVTQDRDGKVTIVLNRLFVTSPTDIYWGGGKDHVIEDKK